MTFYLIPNSLNSCHFSINHFVYAIIYVIACKLKKIMKKFYAVINLLNKYDSCFLKHGSRELIVLISFLSASYKKIFDIPNLQ